MSFSIISLNCRGLRNILKRKAVFLYLKRFNTDFCFLQESHSTVQDVNFWRSQWGLDLWMSHGNEHSAGVCVLKKSFSGKILFSDCDANGHYILLALQFASLTYVIANIYGYNSPKDNKFFFDNLGSRINCMLSKFPNSSLILGGDFNVVLNNTLDRWPPQPINATSDYLLSFMQKFSVIDVWRETHSLQKVFTWNNNSLSSQSRLDFG